MIVFFAQVTGDVRSINTLHNTTARDRIKAILHGVADKVIDGVAYAAPLVGVEEVREQR